MRIMNMLLPSGIVPGAEPLYSNSGAVSFPVSLRAGEVLDLDAYYNIFPSEKYRSRCGLRSVAIVISCEGRVRMEIVRHHPGRRETEHVPVSDAVEVQLGDETYFGIKVIAETDSVISGIAVTCGTEPRRRVDLAHIVCTYRMEDHARKRISAMRAFCSDPRNGLSCPYHLYVIDNGGTLGASEDELVSVIPSPNYGGSGGFGRGMLTAHAAGHHTHFILNDDDAVLEPESVLRACAFHSLVLDEHADMCISGIMFNLETPTRVYEAGAVINGVRYESNLNGVEMGSEEGLMVLSADRRIDYANWTFFCAPMSAVDRFGYPLPLFIKEDDAEYGLRIGLRNETVPGISVWHLPYETKLTESQFYYGLRNRLQILCGSGNIGRIDAARLIINWSVFECYGYRYSNCDACADGVMDFLRGPEHLFSLYTRGMYRSEHPAEAVPMADLEREFGPFVPAPEKSRMRCILSLDGLLSRPRGSRLIKGRGESRDYYRAGAIVYDLGNGTGRAVRRDRKRSFRCIFRAVSLQLKVILRFGRLRRAYMEGHDRYTSEEFWRGMFGSGALAPSVQEHDRAEDVLPPSEDEVPVPPVSGVDGPKGPR